MFGVPRPTPFDVTFGLFRVPVRVSGWFWLGAAFFGWNLAKGGLPPDAPGVLFVAHLLMVALCILVSILIHELGHALVARLFGMDWQIVLLMFGGLAFGPSRPGVKWWQNVLIALAGPAAQFVLLALVLAGTLATDRLGGDPAFSPLAATALNALVFVNLAWPVLNLLPIFPLDGGQALRAVLARFLRTSGVLWTARIGLLCCVLLGVAVLRFLQDAYALVLLGFLGVQNYQLMQAAAHRR